MIMEIGMRGILRLSSFEIRKITIFTQIFTIMFSDDDVSSYQKKSKAKRGTKKSAKK